MRRLTAMLLALVLALGGCMSAASAEGRATARTPLDGSTRARRTNIEIAAGRVNGTLLDSGERFSFNDTVGPRTEANGFQTARNGRGVQVTGGGVAQVASTLYLALCELGDEISFDEKRSYGNKFTEGYVDDADDAILVDESSGIDFAFTNLGGELLIEMWATEDYLYCAVEETGATDATADWAMNFAPAAGGAKLASASISLSGATDALINNVLLAAGSINDSVIPPGGSFSFNDSVGPRSESCGYETAVNGRGVQVTGGGVAQVASAIWLAVKGLDCVAIVEKSTYGGRYNQSYVASSNDAILTDYAAGTDFSFRNTGDTPLTLSTYVQNNELRCEVYGG